MMSNFHATTLTALLLGAALAAPAYAQPGLAGGVSAGASVNTGINGSVTQPSDSKVTGAPNLSAQNHTGAGGSEGKETVQDRVEAAAAVTAAAKVNAKTSASVRSKRVTGVTRSTLRNSRSSMDVTEQQTTAELNREQHSKAEANAAAGLGLDTPAVHTTSPSGKIP